MPKLLGLIVDPRSGEVGGLIDASDLLSEESLAELTEALGEVVISLEIEADREMLERVYSLPAYEGKRRAAKLTGRRRPFRGKPTLARTFAPRSWSPRRQPRRTRGAARSEGPGHGADGAPARRGGAAEEPP